MCALLPGGFRCCDLGLGFLLGLGLFKILDGKLELLDQQPAALGRLPELLAPRLGQHQLQPLDFQPADAHFAVHQRQQFALRKDHRVRWRHGDVMEVGVMRGLGLHKLDG